MSSHNIYFANGESWRLPDNTDLALLTNQIKAAMQDKTILEHKSEWDGESQTLLFNGDLLTFVAIGTPGHFSR